MTKAENPLETWGGIECTVNRVGDEFFDQLLWNGHELRSKDLFRISELGIQTLRYPVLWERTAPDGLDSANWTWADERLRLLRSLNIRPILGLVHHGSGPRYTSLIDPAFPEKLAEYARAVAERYPWVDAYTPINEPLTTARFSGLYGHWFPHLKDSRSFIKILFHEIRATQEAMRAIREINPTAQLIQTEDLGKIYSASALEYQARHENERRWLTFDLLCGRVDRQHPLFDYLRWLGIQAEQLEDIQHNAIPPDILGINYYVTSERYLDDRLDLYPDEMHGSNGRETYVDLESIRVCLDEPAGHAGILQEAWERYHLPLALTEVHLGGHREQQLRWWVQAWNQAVKLRESGTDVRAITAWSMLGSFNWHNLVTRDDGLYESGVFDIRSPTPRPTLLARAIEATTQNRTFEHPIVDAPGWWQTERRLLYPPVRHSAAPNKAPGSRISKKSRPLLITGANGTLGQAFQRICTSRDISFHAVSRTELDIANVEQVRQVLSESRPWAVINSAGYVRVDDAEREPDICVRANVTGPAILAELCAEQHIPLLSFSSDLVFNGEQSSPYLESDIPAPLNTYGLSKAEAETRIMEANEQSLLIRTSAFFGPWDSANFLMQVARSIALHQEFFAAEDVLVSPTYVPDLVHASLDLLIDGESGIWHLANQGEVSWFDFAHQFIHTAGLNDACLRSAPLEVLPFMAVRPRYSVLSSERGPLLPPLEEAISQFVQAAGQVKS